MTQDSHKTSSDSNFSDFGLNETLVQTLAELGYQTPTAIQAQTIPLLLQGEDVLGTAQTGTGKTAAFALPMLQQIDLSRNQPQVLVLTPTRELAIQVSESFEKYASRMQGLRVAAIYGGQDYQVQFRKLSRGAHVIVGTPGRVMDHMRRESLVLEGIRCLVLDEADEMLRMGFAEDVEHILGHLPDERQIALFSATMPEPIRQIAAQHLRTPAEINIRRKAATAETIRQRFVVSTIAQKQAALQRILEVEPIDGVLVFVKTRMTCEPLAESLADCGYRTAALHGDIAQKQRERIIDQLRAGNLDIIVATDVAARGLDVPRISHVFNYDLPFDSEAYVHRIGRTGRAGRSGEAILFVSPRERMRLKRLEQATRQSIEPMELPTNRDINKRRVAKFHAKLAAALGHKDLESFSSIVEQFRKTRDDVTMEQIAAALAVLANGQNALLERNEWKPATFQTDERRRDRPSRDRDERPGRSSPRDRGGPARNRDEAMETFRIEVGREHGVSPGNIVGAIANEIGIDAAYIGRIEIRDDYSMVDLPEGLPNDLFQTLQRVHVLGKKLNISRVTGGPGRESRDRRARVSDEPSSRRSNRAQGGEVKKRVKKRRPTAI